MYDDDGNYISTVSLGGSEFFIPFVGYRKTGKIEKIVTSESDVTGCAFVFKGRAAESYAKIRDFSNNKADFIPPDKGYSYVYEVHPDIDNTEYYLKMIYSTIYGYGTGYISVGNESVLLSHEFPLMFNNKPVSLNADKEFYWPLEEIETGDEKLLGVSFCEPSIQSNFFNNMNKWETIDKVDFNIPQNFGVDNPITYTVRKKHINRNDVFYSGLYKPLFGKNAHPSSDDPDYIFWLPQIDSSPNFAFLPGMIGSYWACKINSSANISFKFKSPYDPYYYGHNHEFDGKSVIITDVSEVSYETSNNILYITYL